MPESAPNPPPASTPPVQLPPFDPRSFVDTAIAVLTKPQEFWKSIKAEQGFTRCLMFSVPMGVVAGVLGLLSMVIHGMGFAWGLRMLVQYAIGGLIGPFIGGIIVWGISLAFGSKASFEPSIRIAAYSAAVWPFALACTFVPWIGWLGALAAGAYGLYLVFLGAKELNFEPAPTLPPAPPPAS